MSAVILLAIVVAWAVVLVPMLLRRHDEASEGRSVEKFASAMRILSRRSGPVDPGRELAMSCRPSAPVTATVNGTMACAEGPARLRAALLRTRDVTTIPAPHSLAGVGSPVAQEKVGGVRKQRGMKSGNRAGESAPPDRPDPEAVRAKQLNRRQRTLLVLAALPVLLLVPAMLVSPWLWALQVLVDVLLVGFVVHLRQEAARQRARRAHLAQLARRARAAESVAVSGAVRVRPPAWAASSYARAASPPEHLNRAEIIIEKQVDGSWLPVPVPVPTYVTAPPATPGRPAAKVEPVVEERAETSEAERRKAVNE